jgi:hypothetical protein
MGNDNNAIVGHVPLQGRIIPRCVRLTVRIRDQPHGEIGYRTLLLFIEDLNDDLEACYPSLAENVADGFDCLSKLF